jgi:flagellar biosynthetic protein FliP
MRKVLNTIKTIICKLNKDKIKIMLLAIISTLSIQLKALANNVVNVDINGNSNDSIEIIILLTVLSLLPSIVIMMTSFTRITIVLSFLRNAMGLQQTPPNQVMVGIALFLTLFIMSPVLSEINTTAYEPYKQELISQDEFYKIAQEPLKEFMLKNTRPDELNMFITLSNNQDVNETQNLQNLPLTVIVPAFMVSELRRAFIIGFLIFIPFLIIDAVVSTVLMSMGMMMLPPVMISLPFKILLFVLVDGWSLLFQTLIKTFQF